MYRVEERTAEDTLASLVNHKVSGTIDESDDIFAKIQSFQTQICALTRTPHILRLMMQAEFNFTGVVDVTDERAEVDKQTMLDTDWFDSTFCVADFPRAETWARKVHEEVEKGKTVVALLPARTSQKWFHDLVLNAAHDVRFVQGHVVPNDAASKGRNAKALPAACIAVYRGFIPRLDRSQIKKPVGILKLETSFTTTTLPIEAGIVEQKEFPGSPGSSGASLEDDAAEH